MKPIFTLFTSTGTHRTLSILGIHQDNNTLKTFATTKLARIINGSTEKFNTVSLSTIFTMTILRHNEHMENKKPKKKTYLGNLSFMTFKDESLKEGE